MEEQRHTAVEPGARAPGAGADPCGPESRPAARGTSTEPPGARGLEHAEAPETEPESSGGGIVGTLQAVAGPVAGVIGSVIGAASQAWSTSDAGVGWRLRRQAREPLASLYELYPEARLAAPRELGLRFVPIDAIRGTAVAGGAQRGGDFLPLRPFRGENWGARWRRIRDAYAKLQPLPPVDLVKYDGDYWVMDGHNRVAAALYTGGVGVDAMVTELIPLDGQTSERPGTLLPFLGETGEMRAAAQGRRPAMGMRQVEQQSGDEAAMLSESGSTASEQAQAEAESQAEAGAAGRSIEWD
jgi:hypothetical protein